MVYKLNTQTNNQNKKINYLLKIIKQTILYLIYNNKYKQINMESLYRITVRDFTDLSKNKTAKYRTEILKLIQSMEEYDVTMLGIEQFNRVNNTLTFIHSSTERKYATKKLDNKVYIMRIK